MKFCASYYHWDFSEYNKFKQSSLCDACSDRITNLAISNLKSCGLYKSNGVSMGKHK